MNCLINYEDPSNEPTKQLTRKPVVAKRSVTWGVTKQVPSRTLQECVGQNRSNQPSHIVDRQLGIARNPARLGKGGHQQTTRKQQRHESKALTFNSLFSNTMSYAQRRQINVFSTLIDLLVENVHRSLDMTRRVPLEMCHLQTKKKIWLFQVCLQEVVRRVEIFVMTLGAAMQGVLQRQYFLSLDFHRSRVSPRCMGHPGTILSSWVLLHRKSQRDSTARP